MGSVVLALAALVGVIITAALFWPVAGWWSLAAGPFGGSFAAALAGAYIAWGGQDLGRN